MAAGDELAVGIRPEFVRCRKDAAPGAIPAQITRIEDLGIYQIVTATIGEPGAEQTIKAKLEEEAVISSGAAWLHFPPERLRVYLNGKAV